MSGVVGWGAPFPHSGYIRKIGIIHPFELQTRGSGYIRSRVIGSDVTISDRGSWIAIQQSDRHGSWIAIRRL